MVELKHNTFLVEADDRVNGREIEVLDSGIGPLWAYRDDPYCDTPRFIVRALSFEAALGAVVDEIGAIDLGQDEAQLDLLTEDECRDSVRLYVDTY